MEKVNSTMTINLGGGDEVDIETLTVVLANTLKILKKAAQYTEEDTYQKFVVTDVRKGSFIIELMAVVATSPNLLGEAATAVQLFKNFLEIKKHLQGVEPKSVTEVHKHIHIENVFGNVYSCEKISFNAYTESTDIDDALSTIAKRLGDDDQRDGLIMGIENEVSKEKVSFSKEDLFTMSTRIDLSKLSPGVVKQKLIQSVIVGKIDFEGDSKWTIYINGVKENVKMNDEEFRKNIGMYKFTKGTKLDVEMDVMFHVDESGIPLGNRKHQYVITKIIAVYNDEVDQVRLFN